MYQRTQEPKPLPARTIKEINAPALGLRIPVGTEFLITHLGDSASFYSSCKGLGVFSVWNDEFELVPIPEPPFVPTFEI